MVADKRLLILDEDLLVGGTIALIAESAGWACKSNDEPHVFFSLLEAWRPTHIALDLVMPKMDGVEVMVELSRRACTAQIIISSGQDEGLVCEVELGCERAQGYLIARPMQAATALDWYYDHALNKV